MVLGDTALPAGPLSGGSMATGIGRSGGLRGGRQRDRLVARASRRSTPGSPFEKRRPDDLAFEDGRVFVKADGPARGVPFADVLRRANLRLVSGSGKGEATFGNPKPKFSTHSFGCSLRRGHLAAGDRATARQPRRDGDRRRAHPQSAGRPQPDRGRGRDGDRHGAVRAHVLRSAERRADQQQPRRLRDGGERRRRRTIEVHFLDYPDKEINELGARGIGEIGLAGIAAAITAAVHHATGVRVRELPVKIEDLLA